MKMSQTKRKGKYINGLRARAKILEVLALNEEFAQYDLPKKVDRKYRQVIRCLHDLRDKHLIYLKRTEQSEKGGKEKNIWAITFYGLAEILALLNDKEIDRAAEIHDDKWLVFAEWPFLLGRYGKHKFMLYSLVRMLSRQFNFLEGEMLPPFTEDEIKQMGYTLEEWKEEDKYVRNAVLEKMRQRCTNQVLGLHDFIDRSMLKFGLKKMEKLWLITESRTLARYAKNPRIKRHIDKQFEQEEATHKLIHQLKNQWEKITRS